MVKNILRKYLSPKMKMRLSYWSKEIFRLSKGRKKCSSIFPYCFIRHKYRDTFFGYYDISPYNENGEMVYLVLDESKQYADIMLRSSKGDMETIVTRTNAWNWQQGSRLRWLSGSNDVIIFNDYVEGKYISRIVNVRTKEEKQLSWPQYDVDKDGLRALSLNFARLGVKRPGYGYTCKSYSEDVDKLVEEGIDLIDIPKNTSKRIITYKNIIEVLGMKAKDYSDNYINHIAYSPSCKKFMFFWLTWSEGYHKAYLMVYDFIKNTILPLETEFIVSHYLWTDDEHILCTAYDDKGEWHYILYGLDGSKKYMFPEIDFDSHPTRIDDEWIVTDSYPDLKGYQKLFKCNLVTGEVRKFMELFSKPALTVELRTDLHPRYFADKKQVCIDCNIKGVREMCLINMDEKTEVI